MNIRVKRVTSNAKLGTPFNFYNATMHRHTTSHTHARTETPSSNHSRTASPIFIRNQEKIRH